MYIGLKQSLGLLGPWIGTEAEGAFRGFPPVLALEDMLRDGGSVLRGRHLWNDHTLVYFNETFKKHVCMYMKRYIIS